MTRFNTIILFILSIGVGAQDGIRNVGMLRIHSEGGVGFHTNFINDGILDGNKGLVGFYSDDSIGISGAYLPVFYDMEVLVTNSLFLDVAVKVENQENFILGNVKTTRLNSFSSLIFQHVSYHTGASNRGKVDGFVTTVGKQNFIFPVGDNEKFRPLILNSETVNPVASCAYFYVGSDSSNRIIAPFNVNSKEGTLKTISKREFWRLEGSVLSTVKISWNEFSDMELLTDDVDAIVMVGWNKTSNKWESLGGNATGELSQGLAISDKFVPDQYEVITFGILNAPKNIYNLPNYLVTPNGDGINDFLEISELKLFPNHHIRIYDRYGLLVFSEANYTNGFNGIANEGDIVPNRKIGLPSGVYFYLLTMDNYNTEYQGYLYLQND